MKAYVRTGIVAAVALGVWLAFKPATPRALPLQSSPKHRYSFSESATNDASNLPLTDSIGRAHGRVLGVGAKFSGTRLLLPGGDSDFAAYVELPSGLLSSNSTNNGGSGEVSIEGWIKVTANQYFLRWFDFGASKSAPGPAVKITGPGGTGYGVDYLAYAQSPGDDPDSRRLELRDEDPPGGGTRTRDFHVPGSLNTDRHFVLTWKEKTGEIIAYENGRRFVSMKTSGAISDITDVNVWLGRSQSRYEGVNNFAGEWDEFRIYDRVLTPGEVLFNWRNGPDRFALPPPVALEDRITLNPGTMALIPVLRNDRGAGLAPASVQIVAGPSHGTAKVGGDGRILYTHARTGGTSDEFTYTVQDALGSTSRPAKVSIAIDSSLRLPNTTLAIPDEPPPHAFRVVDAFPGLKFQNPLALRSPPGNSNQLFVVERSGIISWIPDVTASPPQRRVFLDITGRVAYDDVPVGELGLQSMAFHPGFATNGWFFVYYTAPGSPYLLRLSRFSVIKDRHGRFDLNAPEADHQSEQALIDLRHLEKNHNGGDLHFGPDGYLYVPFGDGGDQMNIHGNAQRIDKDFFSGILRIDVDRKPGSREPNPHPAIVKDHEAKAFYSVPPDNPFVQATRFNGLPVNPLKVREEFWAVGFRHPWRMSFDPASGELWVGDVGQDTYEEIDIVVKGGNYGWVFREGSHPTPNTRGIPLPEPPPEFNHIGPIWELTHLSKSSEPMLSGNTVIGGLVYEGGRLPELRGAYVFGDFESAHIWALRRTNNSAGVERLAGEPGVSAFGTNPGNGDLLLANYLENKIKRLVRGDGPASPFPTKLSDTGIFADLSKLAVNPGTVAYDPIVAFWSDHAVKRRWFTLPDTTNQIGFAADANWDFPAGMKWIKHFDLEMERGNPATKRRIETRVLIKTKSGVHGVSYQWNDSQTEAFLVEDAGTNLFFTVRDGTRNVKQRWEIPSRAGCLACHTAAAGYALSFNTRQLNQVSDMNGVVANQITTLNQAAYLKGNIPPPETLPAHAPAANNRATLENRARSYLAANCVQCHQPDGAGPGTWDARPHLSLAETRLVNGVLKDSGNDPSNRLIVPGDPAHSMLLQRLKGTGLGRMPPLATHQVDEAAVQLIEAWINQMPRDESASAAVPRL